MGLDEGRIGEQGVWVVYSYDNHPLVSKIFPDEIGALREAVGTGYKSAIFVPFGQELTEAIASKDLSERENFFSQGDPGPIDVS